MARISTPNLIAVLRRFALALDAGVDIVKLTKQESERGPQSQRQCMAEIHERLIQGDTLTEAFRSRRQYFPPLVLDMVEIGETTGKLGTVLNHLCQYYENMLSLRRSFTSALLMPGLQLLAALGIVGLMIWISGMFGEGLDGKQIDFIGLGMRGNSGLVKYAVLLVTIALGGFLLTKALLSGQVGGGLMPLILRIPVLGKCLQSFALARLAWTLGLALDSGADARHSMRMAVRSTQNPHYTQHAEAIDQAILKGREMNESLNDTRVFPDEFISTLAAAELSGTHSASLEHLSKEYDRRARSSSKVLTVFASGAIWVGVSGLLIVLIFRLAMFYIGTLNSALEM